MFAAPFGRILWKEYRVNRALWLSILLIGFVFQAGIANLMHADAQREGGLIQLPMLLSVMYAMGCAALLFSSEREERTCEWLLSLSVPPAPTLAAKIAFAVISTMALQLPLALVSIYLNGIPRHSEPADLWWLWGPNALCVLVWSTLGSLTSRRVMVSIAAMVFWFIVTVWLPIIFFHLVTSGRWGVDSSVGFFWAYLLLTTSFVGVIVADVWLGWRWCRGNYLDGAVIESLFARWRQWQNQLTYKPVAITRVPVRAEFDQSWRRTWQRLIWQERHRESFHQYTIVVGCALGLICATLDSGWNTGLHAPGARFVPRFTNVALLLCLGIPLVMGVLGFEPDANLQQPRFLCNRGISPAAVWLAKHTFWMSRAFLFTGIVFFVCLFFEWLIIPTEWATGRFDSKRIKVPKTFDWVFSEILSVPDLPLWYVLLSYSCGQLASSLCRRGILALILGIFLTCVATTWLHFILFLQVPGTQYPRWLFLGFPVAAALIVTLWQMKARMLEDHSWSRRGKLGLVLAAAPALLVFGFGWYQFAEVAALPPLKDGVNDVWQKSLAEQRQPRALSPDESFVRNRIDVLSRSKLEEDPEAADELIDLMKRDLNFLDIEPDTQRAHDVWRLTTVMLHWADEYIQTNDLDIALEYYLGSLKLARATANRGQLNGAWRGHSSGLWMTGSMTQAMILERVITWANHSSQSPDRIRHAMRDIEAELARFPSAAEAVTCTYLSDRKLIDDHSIEAMNRHALEGGLVEPPLQHMPAFGIVPWGWKRLDRWMTREAEFLFSEIWAFETRLSALPQVVQDSPQSMFPTQPPPPPPVNPLLENAATALTKIKNIVLQRRTEIRAALTRMELIAYRLEHGRLPDRLLDLMANFDGIHLVDPWSDRLFDYYPMFLLSTGSTNTAVMPVGPEQVGITNQRRFAYLNKADYRWFASESTYFDLLTRYGTAFPSMGPVSSDSPFFPIPKRKLTADTDPQDDAPVQPVEKPVQTERSNYPDSPLPAEKTEARNPDDE